MKRIILSSLLLLLVLSRLAAQEDNRTVLNRLENFFNQYTTENARIGSCRLDSIRLLPRQRVLRIYAGGAFGYQPFREETVSGIYRYIKQILPGPVNYYDVTVYADGRPIEELIPNLYAKKKDKTRLSHARFTDTAPWVSNVSRPYDINRGLQGKHIALWQSHGKYYQTDRNTWAWQRPRLFCTTEDQFTQSFILPYVIPMLERAGANVFTPRERDTQRHEVIVDNDTHADGSLYLEVNSRKSKWTPGTGLGFAQHKAVYQDGENPFETGSVRMAPTERKRDKSFAQWVPNIPETGAYAVYVTYRTLPGAVDNAKYLVFHKGGVTEFRVNQQMGGGTWVYLGTFEFDSGVNDYGMVALSTENTRTGVVCADAVRFGGGVGNIARGGHTSGLPRHLEAARYSMQWYGMPRSVYGAKAGANDYIDDINTRGNTVNYLSGGSSTNPAAKGLGVPLEICLALHSDAGVDKSDGIVGSLGIYTTLGSDLPTGSRYASRDLSDVLLSQLCSDIRSVHGVNWTRRSMWNRNYSETRLPAVPSTIIELLSHQNFADMTLGHDPLFKFTVGRAIYKGVLRFVNAQHGMDNCIVQPLPVTHFALSFGKKKNTIELTWQAQTDPLEPSAEAKQYVVYTRLGTGGWDNGVLVNTTRHTVKVESGLVYSYRVTAVNRGGESFPSEVLSACRMPNEKHRMLIVNAFTRLSGPAVINTPTQAGFDIDKDPGVCYEQNIAFCGRQLNFDRRKAGKEGIDALGYSSAEREGTIGAGNTFDYVFSHGKAIQAVGRTSFVSCSIAALERHYVQPQSYALIDLLLGDEQTGGNGSIILPDEVKRILQAYRQSGGGLFASGTYLTPYTVEADTRTIISTTPLEKLPTAQERANFMAGVLKYFFK